MVIVDKSKASDLSPAQDIILAVASIPVPLVSMGSSLLLVHVDTQRRKRMGTLGRILACMSICDILSTIQVVLQGFLSPKD